MQCGNHLEQVLHRKKKKFWSDGCPMTEEQRHREENLF